MNIFFISPPQGSITTLPEEESMHCIRVLRMKSGDTLALADGQGKFYTAVITKAHDKHCEVEITGTENFPRRPWAIHLAVAPTKSIDRFEWLLEKVTELGCDRITPLLCEHSERKQVKHDRLQKVLVSALKQSRQPWLPQLDAMTTFHDFISGTNHPQKFICMESAGNEHSLKKQYRPGTSVTLTIGPEGDFSPAETEAAKQKGFLPCSMGSSRLRTETAGLVACHTVHVLNA